MRLALVGNCQIRILAESLSALLPSAVVTPVFIGGLTPQKVADALSTLPSYDLVFSHAHHDPSSLLTTSILRNAVPSLHIIPSVMFGGFHPDFLSIDGLLSPLGAGTSHSRIVIAAYLNGLSSARTIDLFNSFIYSSLGYFEHFDDAKNQMLSSARGLGYDLQELFQSWLGEGSFVHIPYHPKPWVLASIAKLIAVRMGLVEPGAPIPDIPNDFLGATGTLWPVYPEIAKRLNIDAGPFLFRLGPEHGRPPLDLDQFVRASYDVYREAPRVGLVKSVKGATAILKSLVVK